VAGTATPLGSRRARAARLGLAALAVAALAMLGRAPASAAQAYDNPSLGPTPCVVLNRFRVERLAPGSEDGWRAQARLENLCGRAMEVRLCFLYAEPVEDRDRVCHEWTMRPWSESAVESGPRPARIVDFERAWRYRQ